MRKATHPYSREELYQFYVVEEKTIAEMCKILGVGSRNTASKILREAGIDTDVSHRKCDKAKNGMSDEQFKEFLRTSYHDEKKSCVDIGNELGVSGSAIRNYMKKYNIPFRGKGEDTPAKIKSRVTVLDKIGMTDNEFRDYLKREYESGRSMSSLAKEFGITSSGMRRYLVKYGIQRRNNTEFMRMDYSSCPNWRGGRREASNGYIEIYCPEHPNANKRKCVYEHQLVMEEYIGRRLQKGEVIHHIDGNTKNNDISNLLLLTNSEHIRLHAILNSSAKRMGKKQQEVV